MSGRFALQIQWTDSLKKRRTPPPHKALIPSRVSLTTMFAKVLAVAAFVATVAARELLMHLVS